MTDDYGLTVMNNNGRIMFDSRRKMNSYVITEIGSGSSTNDTTIEQYSDNPDYIFVKPPAGQANAYAPYVIFTTPSFSSVTSVQFKGWNSDDMSANNGNPVSLTMDYFVAKHSSKVSSDKEYGLIINNSDSDQSIQFDSRSITYNEHFEITSVVDPGSFQPWTPNTGGTSLGDITDYWEINTWTTGLFAPDGKFVQGVKFVGGNNNGNGFSGPIALTYYSAENNGVEDPDSGPGGPDGTTSGPGSTTSNSNYKSRITKQILSAELV